MRDSLKAWGDVGHGRHVKQQVGRDDRQLLLFGGNGNVALPQDEQGSAPPAPEAPAEPAELAAAPCAPEEPAPPPEAATEPAEAHGESCVTVEAPPEPSEPEKILPLGAEAEASAFAPNHNASRVSWHYRTNARGDRLAMARIDTSCWPWANIVEAAPPEASPFANVADGPFANISDGPIVTIEEPWANVVEPAEAPVVEPAPPVAASLPAIPHDEPLPRVEFLLSAWVQRRRNGDEPSLSPIVDAVNGLAMIVGSAMERRILPDFQRGAQWAAADREHLVQVTLDAIEALFAQDFDEFRHVALSQVLLSAGRVAAAIAPARAEHFTKAAAEAAKRDEARRRKRDGSDDSSATKRKKNGSES